MGTKQTLLSSQFGIMHGFNKFKQISESQTAFSTDVTFTLNPVAFFLHHLFSLMKKIFPWIKLLKLKAAALSNLRHYHSGEKSIWVHVQRHSESAELSSHLSVSVFNPPPSLHWFTSDGCGYDLGIVSSPALTLSIAELDFFCPRCESQPLFGLIYYILFYLCITLCLSFVLSSPGCINHFNSPPPIRLSFIHPSIFVPHLLGPWMLIIPMSSEWSVSWHRKPWSWRTALMWFQLCSATPPPMAR